MTIHSTIPMVSMATTLILAAAGPLPAQTLPAGGTAADGAATKSGPRKAPTMDAEMRRTGQVAAPDLHGERTSILRAASLAQRPEMKVRFVRATPSKNKMTPRPVRDDPVLSSEYGKEFVASVEKCRFDVAGRWRTTPGKVLAGTITLRWTIEPSGHVRDVTATAAALTDEAVVACAEKVVAGWGILNSVTTAQALEWTHTFREIPTIAPEVLAQKATVDEP
jgi:hypothetical protein